jgi:hypothetical protein
MLNRSQGVNAEQPLMLDGARHERLFGVPTADFRLIEKVHGVQANGGDHDTFHG